jgi:hypothetical protein
MTGRVANLLETLLILTPLLTLNMSIEWVALLDLAGEIARLIMRSQFTKARIPNPLGAGLVRLLGATKRLH